MPLSRAVFAVLVVLSAVVLTAARVNAQTCEASPDRHAFQLHGEVAGERQFSAPVADRWTFLLQRIQYGWAVRLTDSTGIDLTSITPPFRAGVNHRDIEGWHFRNLDNTGPNEGSVNAPQRQRIFLFSPALEGTGGYRPSDDPSAVAFDGTEGRGSLRILDAGFADLEPGQRARLVYLNFQVCLTWPKTATEIAAEADYNDLEYIDEEKEIMFGCGLDTMYELSAWIRPRYLGGDFDGDDALDDAAQIRRISDGQRGIAICRAGTWTSVFGMDGELATDLPDNGFGALETWHVITRQDLNDAHLSGHDRVRQEAAGDVLILERVEKSQHAIYWHDATFATRTLYRLVEPDR